MANWLSTARAKIAFSHCHQSGVTPRARPKGSTIPPIRCGTARPIKRSRAFLKHGGTAPIPPSLGHGNGVVRGENTCGGQRLCEHLLPGKAIARAAYGTDGLHYSANRVIRIPIIRLQTPRDILMKEGGDVKRGSRCALRKRRKQRYECASNFIKNRNKGYSLFRRAKGLSKYFC